MKSNELEQTIFNLSQQICDLLKEKTKDIPEAATLVCASVATTMVTTGLGCGLTKEIVLDCLSSTWDELEHDILELLAEAKRKR